MKIFAYVWLVMITNLLSVCLTMDHFQREAVIMGKADWVKGYHGHNTFRWRP